EKIMTPEFAQVLQSTAVLGAIVRPLLVATLLVGLWYALSRARLTVRQRLSHWGVVAVVLILWLATVWTLASQGIFELAAGAQIATAVGMTLVPTILFVAAALTILMRSMTIAAAIDVAPLWWLVAYQGYRVTGFIFLPLWAEGFLPGFFALPAGIGDMLTGRFGHAPARRSCVWLGHPARGSAAAEGGPWRTSPQWPCCAWRCRAAVFWRSFERVRWFCSPDRVCRPRKPLSRRGCDH